jgi:restriction system protein
VSKNQRKAISNTISGIMLICSFSIWFVLGSNNIYLLFGIIILTPIIEGIVFRVLPANKTKNRKAVSERNTFSKKEKTHSNQLRSDKEIIQSSIPELSWREFERLCFLYFKAKGYKPKETSVGADGGVDLIIYNKHHKAHEAIQIKHYEASGNAITVKEIRELNSAKRNHSCLLTRFITTSRFTKDALREADKFKMECHDRGWVKSKIEKWQESERKRLLGGKVG